MSKTLGIEDPRYATKVLPLARIKRWRPCNEQYQRIKALYPQGVPLTREAAHALQDAGVDVMWGLTLLLSKADRIEFILFTLRQRQPHVASLFRKAGFEDVAVAIEALRFETPEQAGEAVPVFDRAIDSAGTSDWARGCTLSWAGISARDSVRDSTSACTRARPRTRANASASAWDGTSAWTRARASGTASANASIWDSAINSAKREQIDWCCERILASKTVSAERGKGAAR